MRTENKIYLNIGMIESDNGHVLKVHRPNKKGYYRIPVGIIGPTVSSHTRLYEPNSYLRELKNPNGVINILLGRASLYGECGHPEISNKKEDFKESYKRYTSIKEKCISHHISNIIINRATESGNYLVEALIKPFGPYKDSLEENLKSPTMNTSFSIRSLTSIDEKNPTLNYVRSIITYDYVSAGGFKEASKRFAIAAESYGFALTPSIVKDIQEVDPVFAQENISFNDNQLRDMLEVDEVSMASVTLGVPVEKDVYKDNQGEYHSIMNAFYKR